MSSEAYLTLEKNFRSLLATARTLLAEAESLELPGIIWRLENLIYRLQQGPIRVLVVGTSSAGKSTLVNAAVGSFVAPEGATATSPVPVWIRPGNGEQYGKTFINVLKAGLRKKKTVSLYSYLTDYCYAPSNISDDERRERYQEIEAVEITADKPPFQGRSFTLIDTPGINSSPCDTERTAHTIKRGAEMVVFICSTGNILQTDATFMQELLLGESPRLPISIEDSLFVVFNPKDLLGGLGVFTAFKTSAEQTFGARFDASRQVFKLNLRNARLACAGPYPYADAFPRGVDEDERQWVAKEDNREIHDFQNMSDAVKEKSKNSLKALLDALDRRAEALCHDPSAILGPLCAELLFCNEKIHETKLYRLNQNVIPLSSELAAEQENLEKELRAYEAMRSPCMEQIDFQFSEFVKVIRAQYEKTKASLKTIADHAVQKDERYRIFLDHDAEENLLNTATDSVVKSICSDDWQETWILATVNRFKNYVQTVRARLSRQVQEDHALCRERLSKLFDDFLILSAPLAIPLPVKPTLPGVESPVDSKAYQDGLLCANAMISTAAEAEPDALSQAISNFCKIKRPLLRGERGRIVAWATKLAFANTFFIDIFFSRSKVLLDHAVSGHLADPDMYQIYESSGWEIYHSLCQCIDARKEELEKKCDRLDAKINAFRYEKKKHSKEQFEKQFTELDFSIRTILNKEICHV